MVTLGAPVQIAYAVDDVVAAARRWSERGVGPFFVARHIELRDVRVNGVADSFDHSSAYAQWGEVMVELLCHHAGAEPLRDIRGLHHVAHFVDDLRSAQEALTARGWPEVVYAETPAGVSFAFHDARHELGHLVEVYEPVDHIRRFYGMVRDAANGWDGRDPVRILR